MKLVTLELLLVIAAGRDDGTVLPGAKAKLNEGGVAVRPLDEPVTLRVACTLNTTVLCALARATVTKAMLLPDVGAFGATDRVTFSGVVPLPGLTWSQVGFGAAETTMAVPVGMELIVIVCDGGMTPGVVLKVTEGGLDENVCALAVSKQHTSANMSVPSPNKVFLVVFKTPPLKQDVPISPKGRSYAEIVAIILPLDSLTLQVVSLFCIA